MGWLMGSIRDWDFFCSEAFRVYRLGGWAESHEASSNIDSDDNTVGGNSATGNVKLRSRLLSFLPSDRSGSAMWYKRFEQAATVTHWHMMNGGQQIVGGLLAYCFATIKTWPLKPWQALFITYGGINVLWSIFISFYIPDSPMRAKCFKEGDKRLMVERVLEN
ncbi:hypothetical protein QQX98_009267 [Neonectria punicea]|uniref:Uncharacterized protein n=1 Tax=Neonectria punicea TaxID=979145 RepID=A0ABR1GST8_9HYPO